MHDRNRVYDRHFTDRRRQVRTRRGSRIRAVFRQRRWRWRLRQRCEFRRRRGQSAEVVRQHAGIHECHGYRPELPKIYAVTDVNGKENKNYVGTVDRHRIYIESVRIKSNSYIVLSCR